MIGWVIRIIASPAEQARELFLVAESDKAKAVVMLLKMI
jgi:hypothetical protein